MSIGVAAVALYGAGLTGSLSPCVLPLVPGYLGLLSAPPAGAPGTAASRTVRVALFAGGVTASFVLLGAIVGSIGWGATTTGQWLQRAAGALLLGFGALMVLGAVGRPTGGFRLVRRLPRQPHLQAVALGVGCGAAWSPCVGPLLGAALTAAGGSGSTLRGATLLLAFAAGVLTPFIALAVLRLPRVPTWVRRAGRYTTWASAAIMFVVGGMLVAGWYEAFVQRLPSGT